MMPSHLQLWVIYSFDFRYLSTIYSFTFVAYLVIARLTKHRARSTLHIDRKGILTGGASAGAKETCARLGFGCSACLDDSWSLFVQAFGSITKPKGALRLGGYSVVSSASQPGVCGVVISIHACTGVSQCIVCSTIFAVGSVCSGQ